jgi:hypothetical protein
VKMGRVARTKGVSMRPEDEVRWNRLQGGRRTADFVRHLLDLEESEARRREQEAVLAKLVRFQDELPVAWREDAAWDLPEPDISPIPPEITGASIDMRPVLDSWRRAESL